MPVAILVMAFMFGTVGGIVVPLIFAAVSIPTTLGLVWIFAHTMDMAIYVTNIVTLIGFAIAIDYSMLVVFRYREELALHDDPHDALVKTMTTAGRATLFSGLTVAVGLGLLIFMPRAVHALDGRRRRARPARLDRRLGHLPAGGPGGDGTRREPLARDPAQGARAPGGAGRHRRLAPLRAGDHAPALCCGAAWRPTMLIALALAATDLHLTGGDNRGIPITTEAARGLKIMETTLGPGALAPQQVVIDTHRPGGAYDPRSSPRSGDSWPQLRRDPEVQPETILAPALVPRAVARQANLVDAAGRVAQIRAAGPQRRRRAAGRRPRAPHPRRATCRRPASRPPPTSCSPARRPSASTSSTRATARSRGSCSRCSSSPTCCCCAPSARSSCRLKAVVMNLLSVSATYGLLTLAFQHGWGEAIGLQSSPQIDAWIPIFLFAMLFGLSMDYEVFLLSRMREEWDKRHDNEHAVAYGLEHTGRIITACAIIMIAAFSGFTFGSFVGLQEFGLGPVGRDPARRDARARGARARGDEDHGRVELVPARAACGACCACRAAPARARRVATTRPARPRRGAGAASRGSGPARELDDEGRPGVDADVLPARDAAGPPAQAPEREADELGVPPGGLRAAALGDVDEAEGLVVVDAQRRLLAQDQVADRARLGL